MATTDTTKPNYSRRFFWLGIAVVVLFGGYSLGWFWLAGRLEAEAKTAIAGLSREGVEADCANPTARGYPFRDRPLLRQRQLLGRGAGRQPVGRKLPFGRPDLRPYAARRRT
ncbi:DUF2125 domain-containing protein [Mesorhizobium sp. AaZ16]|uniref:DUF2125 domain-containing protein n=1 Tax=Mesorhizobium sp. AaZ16 TaxID=3402289 RepID=UPI00374E7A22